MNKFQQLHKSVREAMDKEEYAEKELSQYHLVEWQDIMKELSLLLEEEESFGFFDYSEELVSKFVNVPDEVKESLKGIVRNFHALDISVKEFMSKFPKD